MLRQWVFLQSISLCCFSLLVISCSFAESKPTSEKDLDTKMKAAQDSDSRNSPLSSSSIHLTNDVVKPSQIRNKRSSLKGHLYDDNDGLDSAFLYNDQIMQNLLKAQTQKPLSYARSNFFLNYLKPRSTRYNAWDDHSLMHFGKRSLNDNDDAKILVKRSAGSGDDTKVEHSEEKWITTADNEAESNDPQKEVVQKKTVDPWHSMMSFGKKSNPWDHNTLHFGKKNDPWHSMMSFGKKSDNSWDHNTLHFGKKDDPWHNLMSFGKRFENYWDHNTMHFGKRDPFDHNTMHFGKRDPWDHNTLHFGKKDEPWHSMMSFGKKSDPWHSMMSFGKREVNPWDHNTLHFGKRDDPWHRVMSFGKKSENSDMTDLEKREDPWHNMMSFGKKSDVFWNDNITLEDKRDDPWHSMMSFGKKFDKDFGDHFTMHFGKREEPWHSMMSFGKKDGYGFDHNTMHFGKREEPWHSMMSFGKKSGSPWDHNTMHFGKRDEPWHSMMSFGKKLDPWGDHNTLHFGKRDESWHNMMNFGKRLAGLEDDLTEDFAGYSSNPWKDYNGMIFYKKSDPWDHTLHFGKKANISLESVQPTEKTESANSNRIQKRSADMWNDHHTMHFGKKSDPWENHNTMHFGKKSEFEDLDKRYDWDSHNTMHFGKRDSMDYHNTMHFGKREPWDYHNTMHFGKRDPWDYHNTMHFGKRDPWDYHNTMHFGKRDPWDQHNTMHFGKRDPWDQHNTMHFGKRDPWDHHNTMHFGKKSSEVLTNNKNDDEIIEDDYKISDDKTGENEIAVKKRASEPVKSGIKSIITHNENVKNKLKFDTKPLIDNQINTFSSRLQNSLKGAESDNKNAKIVSDDRKLSVSNIPPSEKENAVKQGTGVSTTETDFGTNTKSRIKKRSIESNNENSQNVEPDPSSFGALPRDSFPDTVLHFGKRSTDENSDHGDWSNGEEEKRSDGYWDNHNTLHFGKKAYPWDNHNTMHFGKRDPWDYHNTMHFGKRDPLDYYNALQFGKKFDPWEGHAKMHFGKRNSDWDHNVMHFGKKDDSAFEDLADGVINGEDLFELLFDREKLKTMIQEKGLEQGMDAEQIKDVLEGLESLQNEVRSHLNDKNLPLNEKISLLKSYLKPLIKAILSTQINDAFDEESLSDGVDKDDKFSFINEENQEMLGNSKTNLLNALINPVRYGGGRVLREDEDISDEERSKIRDYLKEYESVVKSKRGNLGKPELKRYFVAFQGPKSIVYPHAWFASQIRRSSVPRSTEFARNMEMRMAEKKEDPYNSYMHFGRR